MRKFFYAVGVVATIVCVAWMGLHALAQGACVNPTAPQVTGTLPNYYAEAMISSSSQTIPNAFTTINFSGGTITDPGGNWSAANNWYVVPTSGVYLVTTKLRFADNVTAGKSFGQGADTSDADSPNFQWFVTASGSPTARNGSLNMRISHFNAGDQVREFAYLDSGSALAILQADISIQLVYSDH